MIQIIIILLALVFNPTQQQTSPEFLWDLSTSSSRTTNKQHESMNKDPDDIGWSIMIGIFILIGVLIPMSLLIFGFISYNNNKRIFGKIKSITLMPDSSDTIKSFSYLPTLSSSSSSLSSSKMVKQMNKITKMKMTTTIRKTKKNRSIKLINYPFQQENYRKSLKSLKLRSKNKSSKSPKKSPLKSPKSPVKSPIMMKMISKKRKPSSLSLKKQELLSSPEMKRIIIL